MFILNFSMKVLEKLTKCEKIPHVKSYLNILYSKQDTDGLRFLGFLTVHGYPKIFSDVVLTMHSLVDKKSKCVSRLPLLFMRLRLFNYFTFSSA
jgi:hypothetical protein